MLRDNLSVDSSASKFEPVGHDSDSLASLNVSGAIMGVQHIGLNEARIPSLLWIPACAGMTTGGASLFA